MSYVYCQNVERSYNLGQYNFNIDTNSVNIVTDSHLFDTKERERLSERSGGQWKTRDKRNMTHHVLVLNYYNTTNLINW